MTSELLYLFLTSVLLTVMWIPHIAGQVLSRGMLKPGEYRSLRDPGTFPDWVQRANRAHINLVEQFGAFAGLVVVAHLAGISNGTTALMAAIYFWARVAHVVVFMMGIPYARTGVFSVATFALLIFAWQIATNLGGAGPAA